jgi:hypothetical protein
LSFSGSDRKSSSRSRLFTNLEIYSTPMVSLARLKFSGMTVWTLYSKGYMYSVLSGPSSKRTLEPIWLTLSALDNA